MATSKEFMQFILEQLSPLEGITHRMMMGEYIIYYNDKIAAYVCDDRLLVKPVPYAIKTIENPIYEPPYEGAKDMILIEDVDSREFLQDLFIGMYEELPTPKPKRKKK